MSDTPETDTEEDASHNFAELVVPSSLARKLERERNEALDALSFLSHYLSCGIGDDTTTAQQYKERIMEGVKFLTEPLVETAQIEELKLRREETIMQCELLKQDVAKAAELLKHIEEQSRNNMTIVVGAPLREAVCSCLVSICCKIDK